MASKRTPWTIEEKNSFINWHETIVRQYPEEITNELRRARHKMLGGIKIIHENSFSQ